uniref:Uncharacterized protein AlNc14C79G5203 n=1 Tax=Albugo laibachii Nc14 TaxID=890382 RepID=F0WF09_9STRA|nr:conserved hypothetical protein [Albugo laibachii Nc14]|eukprot:CCA19791.1 conserved hypothetical protein [Albugo laibachii Nc14]
MSARQQWWAQWEKLQIQWDEIARNGKQHLSVVADSIQKSSYLETDASKTIISSEMLRSVAITKLWKQAQHARKKLRAELEKLGLVMVNMRSLWNSVRTNDRDGYLFKKTRDGKWQKRWFETNGCFLTYYKKQGQKLLAALNLPQVGTITLLGEDSTDGPGLFTIELNERVYTIKARSREEAAFWVDVRVIFVDQLGQKAQS